MVHLAQRVRQPHRALLREQHAQVREPPEEVVQDHARGQLHRGAVAPVHRPLERVEVAEGDVGILAPAAPYAVVRGRPEVHGHPACASLTRAQNGSKTGSATERPPNGSRGPPWAWPARNWIRGVPCSITVSSSAPRDRRRRARGTAACTCGPCTRSPISSWIQRLNARMFAYIATMSSSNSNSMSCGARGEHQRLVDALLVHERQPPVAVAVGHPAVHGTPRRPPLRSASSSRAAG